MTWNYRVIHRKYIGSKPEFDEDIYAIHEVYYDDDGRITGFTEDPTPAYSEDMAGLAWVLEKFAEACKKDILEWGTVVGKSKPRTDWETEPFGITPDGE